MGGKSGSISAQEFAEQGGLTGGGSKAGTTDKGTRVKSSTIDGNSIDGFEATTKSGSTATGDSRGGLSRSVGAHDGQAVEAAALPAGWLPTDRISKIGGRPFNATLFKSLELSTVDHGGNGLGAPTPDNVQRAQKRWAITPSGRRNGSS